MADNPKDAPVMTSTAVKVVSHSLLAVVVLALISVIEEELADGEWPHNKKEWVHFMMTAGTAAAVAIIGLIRAATMGAKKEAVDKQEK